MKKTLFSALVALALIGLVTVKAQTNVPKIVLWQMNLNQTVTPTYCSLTDAVSTSDRVKTTGSSTTVTAVSGAPFANVRVGAMLHIVDGTQDIRRAVTVRNSSTSIVISGAALTIVSGLIQSDSRNVTCATAATGNAGAFSVAGLNKFGVQIGIGQQVNTGGLQFHLQCRNSGDSEWVQRYPDLTLPTMTLSYTPAITATGRFILETQGVYSDCRVGMFIVTADDGNDLTTNAEQVSITLLGRP